MRSHGPRPKLAPLSLLLIVALGMAAACTRTACDQVEYVGSPADLSVADMDAALDGGADDLLPDLAPHCRVATQATDCPATEPACVDGECAACAMATDAGVATCDERPATPYCVASGACVECRTSSDCVAAQKTCGGGACVPCSQHSDCTSGLCQAGVCADPRTVIYVDNGASGCPAPGGDGSFAHPYCTINLGITAAQASPRPIVVHASGTYREQLSLTPGASATTFTFVSTGAVVQDITEPPLTVTGGSKPLTVSFDGFVFDSTGNTIKGDVVSCVGSGGAASTQLTLIRSTSRNGDGYGVQAIMGCTLTMDQCQVVNNTRGGIELDAANFNLTNLLVANNGAADSSSTVFDGTSFGGINVASAGTSMTLVNATIVDNIASTMAQASGIICRSGMVVGNTVVYGNLYAPTQITEGLCGPLDSAYPGVTTASTANNRNLTSCSASDLFVNYATNVQPSKTGSAPCSLIGGGADKVTASVTAPDHDLIGTARPTSKIDIGCYQAGTP